MFNISVLKLDSSFKPIGIIGWEDAFMLTWLKKAYAIEYSDTWVHSAAKRFQIPSVIVLFQYVDEKYFTLSCTRKNILVRDGNKCQYCAKIYPEKALTIDHIVPKSKGGATIWTNVATACKPCNQQKGCLLVENSSVSLIRKPKKPSYGSIIKKRIGKANLGWQEYL